MGLTEEIENILRRHHRDYLGGIPSTDYDLLAVDLAEYFKERSKTQVYRVAPPQDEYGEGTRGEISRDDALARKDNQDEE